MSPVLHLHIPKTGGSTLRGLLETIYGEGFTRAPNRPEEYGTVDVEGSNCISGHFAYGTDWGTGWSVVTMVRDPVDRLLSLYHYLRNPPAVEGGANRYEADVRTMTFAQFATSEREDWPWLDNDQTRRLSGMGRDETRAVTEADFFRALANVESIGFVGLTSLFDVAVERWSLMYGWPEVRYTDRYVQPDRLRAAQLPPHVVDQVLHRQRFDARLVECVMIDHLRIEA